MQTHHRYNFRYLTLITLSATLGGFLFGFDTAVISGTIPFVKTQFGMDALMEGWFVSSALLGCIAGVASSGRVSGLLGRRKGMLLAAALFALSAAGCAMAGSAFWLIAGRLAGGVGIGLASVVCPMYLAELAPSDIRGRLISFYQLAITAGILVAYFSNAVIQAGAADQVGAAGWRQLLFGAEIWRGMFAMGLAPAVLFSLLLFFIPESPRWLAMRGDYGKAGAILAAVSDPSAAEAELDAIRVSLRDKGASMRDLFRGKLARPLTMGMLLAALSQFSGINAIIYYGPSILEKAGFQVSEALGGQVTIGLVNLAFTFVAIGIIDRTGRKPLLLAGIGGATIALLLAGGMFWMGMTGGWGILLCILLFIACFAFSFGPVVWVIISEIFPNQVRSEAVAISTMSLWVANWIVGQFFPVLNQWPALPFFVFACCCLFALWLTWKKIPETKGHSLEEIGRFWN